MGISSNLVGGVVHNRQSKVAFVGATQNVLSWRPSSELQNTHKGAENPNKRHESISEPTMNHRTIVSPWTNEAMIHAIIEPQCPLPKNIQTNTKKVLFSFQLPEALTSLTHILLSNILVLKPTDLLFQWSGANGYPGYPASMPFTASAPPLAPSQMTPTPLHQLSGVSSLNHGWLSMSLDCPWDSTREAALMESVKMSKVEISTGKSWDLRSSHASPPCQTVSQIDTPTDHTRHFSIMTHHTTHLTVTFFLRLLLQNCAANCGT